MVTEGIVPGHKISFRGIGVDRAKVEVIEKLQPSLDVKGIRSFWDMMDSIGDSLRTSQNFPNR